MKLAVRVASTAAGVLFAGASAAGGAHIVCHCGRWPAHATAMPAFTSGTHINAVEGGSVLAAMSNAPSTSAALGAQANQQPAAAGTSGAGHASTATASSTESTTNAGDNAPSTTAPASGQRNPVMAAGSGSGAVTVVGGSSTAGGLSASASGAAAVETTADAGHDSAGLTGATTASSNVTLAGSRR